MRSSLKVLPLPLAIALALPAQAQQTSLRDMPPDYGLCPAGDAVPVFPDAPNGINMKPAERRQQPTELEGDEQSGTVEMPVLEGNVALSRGDQFLGTDKLTFDSEKETYLAEGSVRFQNGGMRIVADRASGNQAEDAHRIENIRYQLTDRRGHGGARQIELVGAQGTLSNATYTTCPPTQTHWQLVANRINVDSEEGFAVAHNATMRIGKVPVLYVPWFKFPIDERRTSGLLFPSISNSNRNGFDYRQPIYFNLAPNYDLTLSPRIMSKRGVSLTTEFRYLYENGAGNLRTTWMPNDKLRNRDRGFLGASGFHNLTRNWRAGANITLISDPRYFEDFNNTSLGVSSYSAFSELGLYGRGNQWNAGFTVDHWQLADYTLNERHLPYDRLPRAWFSTERGFGSLLRTGLDVEAVRFQKQGWRERDSKGNAYGPRQDIPGGSRFDLKPWISLPITGASWFVEPKLAWRYTAYQLDEGLARQINPQVPDRGPSRSLPIYSVDAGMYFDREFERKGQSHVQTLEPRLFYLRAPYRNQDGLPIFDTSATTFSWGQLFRDNRYSGADRQSDANQLTTAITTRILRDSDGFEKFNASLGQIRYFNDVMVGGREGQPAIERGRSAWVADANWAPSDRWNIGASYQWDPRFSRRDLVSVRGRYLFRGDGIVNLAYRYRRNLLEQADLSFVYPISPAWSLVGRYYYSIKDRKPLETVAGVQWDSCCVAMRVVGRQYIRNREGDLNNAIMLEIEFKGLGSAGQDTRNTLRRAILGYYRDDLYLVPPPSISNGAPALTPDSTDTSR
ncbi:LPS-assembly protein LptD [Lysobacter pythonis]|uniref:LPS-assembly protein LptD n=1 Tax=Solilutibacter pythonis TaxID=2483112 RepID=A0A3M2HI74_9GAMM|nr:LPS-assembly protein LptD [Lysobacter pythonis]RMH88688.1 LPS-assembly protein LptD [Lysobacter pythonis]